MKALLVAAALVLTTASTHAQQSGTSFTSGANGQENLKALINGSPTVVPDTRYEGLRGSPYAVARWLPAVITTSHDAVLQPVPLKYDVFQRRLLMRNPQKGDSIQLNDNLIKSFVLTDALLPDLATGQPYERHFRRFLEAPEMRQQAEFVEVLHAGKQYTLLKRYVKKLDQASYKGAYSSDKRYDELLDKNEYYLRRPDGTLETMKPTLKALQAAAPKLADALKAEAGKQKINGKSDAELARLLNAVDPA